MTSGDQTAKKTNQDAPDARDQRRSDALADIAQDAKSKPAEYARDTEVPAGGE